MIKNYTGLNFNEVLELPYSLYLLYKKEAWVDSWRGTPEGANFLKDLWRLQQTEADMQSVKKFNERGY